MPFPDLLARVRRARLVQVLVVYLGASWVLLQVADTLTDTLSLPGWVSPVVVLLLLTGLLIVLATAWVQSQPLVRERAAAEEVPEAWELDVRDLGRSVRSGRLPHLTWARALVAGGLAFAVLTGFAAGWMLFGGGADPVTSSEGGLAPGVAVLPFEVRGIQDQELWGDGLVDLLSTNLDGLGGFRAIDSRTVLARWREGRGAAGELEDALEVAASAGARYAVLGSVVGAGDRVRVSARLHAVADGAELGLARVEGEPDSVLALVDRLSVELARQLLSREDAGDLPLRSLASITTSSVPALRSFLRGEAANRRADFADAAVAYEEALAGDSTFALAAYRLATAYGWMDALMAEEAQRLRSHAERHAHRLPPRDAALVRGLNGALQEADPEALGELERLARSYPDDPEVWYALGEARFHLGGSVLVPASSARDAFERAIALDSTFAPAYIHVLEIRLAEARDPEGTARLLESYAAIAEHDARLSALRLAHALTFGDRRAAVEGAAEVPVEQLNHLIGALSRGGAGTMPAAIEVVDVLGRRLPVGTGQGPGFQELRAWFALQLGRTEEALAGVEGASPEHLVLLAVGQAVFHEGPVAEELRVAATFHDRVHPTLLGPVGMVAAFLERPADMERVLARLRARSSELEEGVVPHEIELVESYHAWRRGDLAGAAERLEALRQATIGYGAVEQINELARFLLGRIEAERGRHDRALAYLRSVSSFPVTHLLVAESLEALGRHDEARLAYADALRIWSEADPGFPGAERARRGLARLRADQ